ncbi:MAG: glycosyltransferase family 4 protein, partial [Actinomycetota bacterium]|nr:glycosyltransferase family 4 protein [Actinomycetota bacterium]
RERPDVIHTHTPKPGLYGRIIGRLAGVPAVLNTVHGLYATPDDRPAKRAIVYALEALAARFSDAELIQSAEDHELLIERRITRPDRTVLLGNGVDLERFAPVPNDERLSVRRALGIDDERVVVGMVGRLVAEKGYNELFEAASKLDDRCIVVVIGPHEPDKDDGLDPAVVARAEQEGVRFLGMRSDVDALYGAMDIFVLPSHREGFPRAAMEAAATGIPVVATDIRGCREVVDPGVNGLLVPVRDADALAAG